jgi:hypothetical protein
MLTEESAVTICKKAGSNYKIWTCAKIIVPGLILYAPKLKLCSILIFSGNIIIKYDFMQNPLSLIKTEAL